MDISHALSAAAIGGLFGWTILPGWFPERDFLEVHQLYVEDRDVFVERTYNVDGVGIADWRVTVLGPQADAPICQTIPGDEEHEGWSRYYGPAKVLRQMTLDEWVGDPGCFDRLQPGTYDMFVTWTPRDGREPIATYTDFTVQTP